MPNYFSLGGMISSGCFTSSSLGSPPNCIKSCLRAQSERTIPHLLFTSQLPCKRCSIKVTSGFSHFSKLYSWFRVIVCSLCLRSQRLSILFRLAVWRHFRCIVSTNALFCQNSEGETNQSGLELMGCGHAPARPTVARHDPERLQPKVNLRRRLFNIPQKDWQ